MENETILHDLVFFQARPSRKIVIRYGELNYEVELAANPVCNGSVCLIGIQSQQWEGVHWDE